LEIFLKEVIHDWIKVIHFETNCPLPLPGQKQNSLISCTNLTLRFARWYSHTWERDQRICCGSSTGFAVNKLWVSKWIENHLKFVLLSPLFFNCPTYDS
jgi:hypothetical protein